MTFLTRRQLLVGSSALASGALDDVQAIPLSMQDSLTAFRSGHLIATTAAVLADPQRRAVLTGIRGELYLEQFQRRSQPAQLVAIDEQAIAAQQRVADAFYKNHLIRQPVDVRPLWHSNFTDLLNS